MPTLLKSNRIDAAAYEALRKGGTPAASVQTQLELPAKAAARLEGLFHARAFRGDGDPALPKFARHDSHVAAVMAQGGYPAFSERRKGRDCVSVCRPLLYPSPIRVGGAP